MPEKRKDVDGDGFPEPLFAPENIDEASDMSENIGLGGDVHSVEVGDEDFFAPGEDESELDRVQENAKRLTEMM